MERVEVHWIDSVRCLQEWTDADEARADIATEDGQHVRSVGWLFVDETDYIVLVLSTGDNGHVCDGMLIPRSAVKEITELQA